MDGFLGKPIAVDDLADLLRRSVASSGATPVSDLSEPLRPEAGDAGAALDAEVISSLRDAIGTDTVREIVGLFLVSLADAVPAIISASRDRDRHLLARTAHELKSGARMLGAYNLGELLDQLEREATEADWPHIDALVARVQAQRIPTHDQLLAQID